MRDLGVELYAVDGLGVVCDRGEGGRGGVADDVERGREGGELVAMGHPYLRRWRCWWLELGGREKGGGREGTRVGTHLEFVAETIEKRVHLPISALLSGY